MLESAPINSKIEKIDIGELKLLGVMQEDLSIILMPTPLSGIYLIDGVAYKDGKIIPVYERGKLSWAVKAIRAVADKLSDWVKGALGVKGLDVVLKFVDHFTGTVEDAVFLGCKELGMSDSVAWAVTKVITFLAL